MSDIKGTASLSEQAYRKILEDIVWCRLPPGEEISEARLCETYGFGKAPIRQALSRLAQDAYVVSRPRRGHIIAPVTLRDVRELFGLRLVVEPAISELACGQVDSSRLRQLDAACAKAYTPGGGTNEARYIAANKAFHLEIAKSARNSRLMAILEQNLDEVTRLLHLGYVFRERLIGHHSEHERLIEALACGDRVASRELTIQHISRVQDMVIHGITQYSSLSDANIVAV